LNENTTLVPGDWVNVRKHAALAFFYSDYSPNNDIAYIWKNSAGNKYTYSFDTMAQTTPPVGLILQTNSSTTGNVFPVLYNIEADFFYNKSIDGEIQEITNCIKNFIKPVSKWLDEHIEYVKAFLEIKEKIDDMQMVFFSNTGKYLWISGV